MPAIDRAALVETVAQAIYDDEAWGKERVAEEIITTVARKLLAPLRELHKPSHDLPDMRWAPCTHCWVTWPCATARLLDQIEDDLKGTP